MILAFLSSVWISLLTPAAPGPVATAQSQDLPAGAAASSQPAEKEKHSGYWRSWPARVARAHAAQPDWLAPLVTTSPRLAERLRYDIGWQQAPNGTVGENYGLSKGVQLIPEEHIELLIAVPPYIVHNQPAIKDGFGDESFRLKYRLLSGNAQHGNYILTLYLSGSAPTGQFSNGSKAALLTPTVAFGKGWGDFNIQGNLGVTLPTNDTALIGRTVGWNTAFQYRVLKVLWPELEVNASYFEGGPKDGKEQVFLTPGVLFGRFPLGRRLKLHLGGGVQIATSRFHTSNHNPILSVRLPF
jgi:hypothetical protein